MTEKPVYVIFSHTNTGVGRLIRIATRHEYNHTALAFDRGLSKMYSFARYNKRAPLYGGFVTETPARYLDGGDIKIKVARLFLPQRDYCQLRRRIADFERNDRDMLYNHIGAAAALFHRRLRIPGCYICFEFVAAMLGYGEVRTISQFERALEKYVVYEGSFSEYTPERLGLDTPYFTAGMSPVTAACATVKELAREAHRALIN